MTDRAAGTPPRRSQGRRHAGDGAALRIVLAATGFVLLCIEVIGSRYRDFKLELKIVVAENASGIRVVGGVVVPSAGKLDLCTHRVMEMSGDGVGIGTEKLGLPATAIAMHAIRPVRRGHEIAAGTMVMSGGVTKAAAVKTGDHVDLRVQGAGKVSARSLRADI